MVITSGGLREPSKERTTVAELKHYRDAEGHVFSMSKEHAEKLGYTLAEEQPKAAAGAAAPVDVAGEQAAQDAGGSEAAGSRTAAETRPANRGR